MSRFPLAEYTCCLRVFQKKVAGPASKHSQGIPCGSRESSFIANGDFCSIFPSGGERGRPSVQFPQRKGNATTTKAGYFGEFVDDNEKQRKIQAKRRFLVQSSDHIDGESPLQELVSEARHQCNQAVVLPVKRRIERLGNWWNSTLLGRLGRVYNERRALSVKLYRRWPVLLLFVIFQGSMIGTELIFKYFKVGGLLRPLAVLAVSFFTGPPFIEAFLPGIIKKRDYDPPNPKEDAVFDDEPVPKWRPPEEVAAEEFLRPIEES
ncbi:hypothetical protein KFL_000050450 [Klebsormidium nitens]|uniref:Uncharacterized protein n=1 Tax=Klebsormidium nitens TaxID=105231 RepID=A0A1Y1HPZ9_KLENI|nr:hypothetical protein KFL_000050450 [Klebsormidium nitens]|eukprot:GAQ77908.1 hypothetical protein KFL_000050450 [Klebsormidium nitens]